MIRITLLALLLALATATAAEPLPNTKPLTEEGDLAAKMVAGIHKYLDRELADAPKKRDELWKADFASKEALLKSLPAKRERLRKILGIVDERVKPNLEYISGPGKPSLLAEIDGCKIHAVRWAVLPGIDAEGLLIEPKEAAKANVVAIPHADFVPEILAGLTQSKKPVIARDAPLSDRWAAESGWRSKNDDFALQLARQGFRVLIPTMINRNDDLSGNAKLKKQTNIPHREFIYRMAFEMGRSLAGFEVQKVLAAVDWFTSNDKLKVGIIGYGDGGMIALYAGALDERITATHVVGYFDRRVGIHEEPIDRNVWGLLREFGDAELGAMIDPRKFIPDQVTKAPAWTGPKISPTGRSQAAPGLLKDRLTSDLFERHRYKHIFDPEQRNPDTLIGNGARVDGVGVDGLLYGLEMNPRNLPPFTAVDVNLSDLSIRHQRQFEQLVAFNQKLWRNSDTVRKEFWKKTDVNDWEKSCDFYREYFHSEVIGKLPEPTLPLNPRTRQVYDEAAFTGYEVMLDVYLDVFAQGILMLPKNLKANERRPVVVCQHGLEGTPRKCIDAEKGPTYFEFARRLVEKGYIVYCPQNPYYGGNTFRQIQRKANPLGLSLFSFIVRQHQRTLDWLETLPNVDAKKIAFYGLSYGGKTAMRVPAIEKRYCLSICSGDFNEWIGKNVSVDLDRSYMWSGEYEMYEFNLGHTFNYAEMAYLIAPRPFYVERGHDDGVGTDDMVASEFAKVRYLYAKLKLPDRTGIDFQSGGHRIFLKGSLEFLTKHLGEP